MRIDAFCEQLSTQSLENVLEPIIVPFLQGKELVSYSSHRYFLIFSEDTRWTNHLSGAKFMRPPLKRLGLISRRPTALSPELRWYIPRSSASAYGSRPDAARRRLVTSEEIPTGSSSTRSAPTRFI